MTSMIGNVSADSWQAIFALLLLLAVVGEAIILVLHKRSLDATAEAQRAAVKLHREANLQTTKLATAQLEHLESLRPKLLFSDCRYFPGSVPNMELRLQTTAPGGDFVTEIGVEVSVYGLIEAEGGPETILINRNPTAWLQPDPAEGPSDLGLAPGTAHQKRVHLEPFTSITDALEAAEQRSDGGHYAHAELIVRTSLGLEARQGILEIMPGDPDLAL